MTTWLQNYISFSWAVHAEDFMLLVTGYLAGLCTLAIIVAKFLLRLQRDEKLNKMILVRLKHEEENHYYANPKTFMQALEVVVGMARMVLTGGGDYKVENEKRTRRFVIWFYIIFVVCVVLAIWSVWDVVIPLNK